MASGVINIYKEKGMTSFHVVHILRKLTGEKKVGHTGTLDPDATGVLAVCFGRATKLVGQLMDTDKVYRAVMIFGKKTDTQDVTGNTLEELPEEELRERLSEDRIRQAVASFRGEIRQLPPMYSALKVGGVKLVDAARKGRTIERGTRSVSIYEYRDVTVDMEHLEASFTVKCSKGTYIRTLCEDIGERLGVPACMKCLERLESSGLRAEEAITLEQAEQAAQEGRLEEFILPIDHFLRNYGSLTVCDEAVRRLVFGNTLYPEELEGTLKETAVKGDIFRIYDRQGNFYALYRYDGADRGYKCHKMFY